MSLPGKVLLALYAVTAAASCASPTVVEKAQALVRQHRDEDAAALLRTRIAKDPEDAAARRLLVRVLGLTGDLPGARAQADDLARQLPAGDPTPYIELGHAFELSHRYEEALAAYDEAARVAPLSPEGPREGGMRCARWGETGDAAPRLEEAIRRGAHDPETWHALGLVRLHEGDLDGAEEAYRSGAAADPVSADAWLGLATVAIVRADPSKALAAYDEVLRRKPAFAPAELGRAWALAKLGRTAEASRALDRAEEMGAPRENIAKQRAALAPQKP
jgi:tetratricopeptide (TPR) repeat protein